MSWNHFDKWDLETDFKAAKTKQQKAAAPTTKSFGDGIAAQLGLKKKKQSTRLKRVQSCDIEKIQKRRKTNALSESGDGDVLELLNRKNRYSSYGESSKSTSRVAEWLKSTMHNPRIEKDMSCDIHTAKKVLKSSRNGTFLHKTATSKTINNRERRNSSEGKEFGATTNSRLNGDPLITTPDHKKEKKKKGDQTINRKKEEKLNEFVQKSPSHESNSQSDFEHYISSTNSNKKTDTKSSKKIRPASFVLKITGVSTGTQTDSPPDFNATHKPQKVKFKINLKHDQFATRTDTTIYDKKGENLSGFYESLLDRYEPKRYSGEDIAENCFITLTSRFKVMHTKDMGHVELLPELHESKQNGEPIRIHTLVNQQHYRALLHENAYKSLPDIIITRIFPSSYAGRKGSRQTYTYPEGDTYEGDWSKEGKKHGIGQLRFVDGSVYEGRFMHGLCNGVGTFNFADGSSYQGEFSNGLYNGHGIYIRSDGMMFEGAFRNGRPDGLGMITFADGSHGNPKQEGYFEGTRIVKRENVAHALKKARLSAERAKKATLESSLLN